jgi:hypothetical protein
VKSNHAFQISGNGRELIKKRTNNTARDEDTSKTTTQNHKSFIKHAIENKLPIKNAKKKRDDLSKSRVKREEST